MGLKNTLFPPIVETNPAPFVWKDDNTTGSLKVEPAIGQTLSAIGYRLFDPYGGEIKKDSDTGDGSLSYNTTNKVVDISSVLKAITDSYIRNQYYRLQLRAQDDGNYSAWSSTILIRLISNPVIKVTTNFSKIIGCFYFEDEQEQEQFKNYKITISQGSLTHISKVFSLSANSNNFTYQIPVEIDTKQNYTGKIEFETYGGYKGYSEFSHSAGQETENEVLTISAKSYPDLGGIMVYFNSTESSSRKYTLMRSTHKTNFGYWEILGTISVGSKAVSWLDITAESGVWYKYKAISEPADSVYYSGKSNPILLDLDSIFLSDEDTQFLVALNEDVNGFKYVVTESVTNTLGSKYPFVRRSANTKYRQFNIGGMISFLADEEYNVLENCQDSVSGVEDFYSGPTQSADGYRGVTIFKEALFLTKQNAFQQVKDLYDDYSKVNGYEGFEDSIFERAFRDQAMEFLTNGKPKLFRSATEGNILVTLTNVSFTPNKQLGRRIYSFTATATEIDECTIENYKKYNILRETSELSNPYVLAFYGNEIDGKTLVLSTESISESRQAIVLFQINDLEA